MHHLTYLALGDSYTIGEGVPLANNFPYQTIQLLRQQGMQVAAPEIIAVTGWTTGELQAAIDKTVLLNNYDIVSLLIGVNNQYRGRSIEEYESEFEQLVKQAIGLARSNAAHVFVLSIPDWGVTPFAGERDLAKIAAEIDAFNAAKKRICGLYNVGYIDITASQRQDGNKDVYLAADRLHPSGLEYRKWADKLTQSIKTAL